MYRGPLYSGSKNVGNCRSTCSKPVRRRVDARRPLHGQPAVRLRVSRRPSANSSQDVRAELLAEVAGVQPAGLQLQDHLADQPLARRRREGPAERQLAAVERLDVVLPGVDVLHVDAADVAERRHAGAEHVGPVPQASR